MPAVGRLQGSVAMITGAAQGIGAAFARGLVAQGAAVAVCDLADPSPVVDSIRATGARAFGAIVDVTDAAALSRFVGDVNEQLGPVDILVNNAALFAGLPRKPFTDITAGEWNRVLSVNTLSVLECAKAVLPGMRERGYGKIINIASTTAHHGSPNLLHYVASKGAVISMTRAMAREVGEHGIAVNCIAPGLTMSEAGIRDTPLASVAGSTSRRSFKREQRPEDLVGTLVFLASHDSDFTTGQTFVVDGGSTMI